MSWSRLLLLSLLCSFALTTIEGKRVIVQPQKEKVQSPRWSEPKPKQKRKLRKAILAMRVLHVPTKARKKWAPKSTLDDAWVVGLVVALWLGIGLVLLVVGLIVALPVLWIIGLVLLLLFLILTGIVFFTVMGAGRAQQKRIVPWDQMDPQKE